MTYPDSVEDLKANVQGTDAMVDHADLHNDTNKVVNSLQTFVGTKTDTADSNTIAGNINDLVVRVEEIETNGGGTPGDSFPDTTDHEDHALMVREGAVDWSQITPDDVRYPEDVVFVLPDEEVELGGKTQGEINKALRDALRQLDGAVDTNIANISTNETNIETNKGDINKIVAGIGGSVDIDGNISLPGDGTPIDISGKLDKGVGLVAEDAKELEDAIGTNATNIDANKTNINSLVVNIGGTVDGNGNIINLPNDGNPIDISDKFDKGTVSLLTDAGIMETEIRNVANRLTALENTSLTASWKINISDSATPADGEIVINAATWEAVTNIKVATEDADGTIHSFGNVAEGDTIQIGVGPEARAAGSSAAYIIDAINADGDYSVSHLSSSGAPSQDFIAIIAVYPAFDPNNYATVSQLNAVEANKLSRGADLKAANAKELEDAISDNEKVINNLAGSLNLEINADGSIIINPNPDPDTPPLVDVSDKLDKGKDLVAKDAKELEEAIGENAVNIETLVVALGGSIDSIGDIEIDALPPQAGEGGKFLTTDGDEASWAEPKTGDIKLSEDAALFAELPDGNTATNQSEVNQYLYNQGLFRGTVITWGDLANYKP